MKKIKVGSLIKFYTILLLNESPKHGYELMKELEEKLGRKVSTSQVYPFLQTLEKNGLIKIEKKGRREKKIYSLTREGRHFVDSILSRFGDLIHVAIEPKLSICAHCGCKVYEGGHREVIRGRELTFCCKYCAESFKRARRTD